MTTIGLCGILGQTESNRVGDGQTEQTGLLCVDDCLGSCYISTSNVPIAAASSAKRSRTSTRPNGHTTDPLKQAEYTGWEGTKYHVELAAVQQEYDNDGAEIEGELEWF